MKNAKMVRWLGLAVILTALTASLFSLAQAQVFTGPNRGGSGSASTNNVTLTGRTIIRTNLLVDASGAATISPTNALEVVTPTGAKAFNVGTNETVTIKSDLVIKGTVLATDGIASIDSNNRSLNDSSENVSIDWENYYLTGNDGSANTVQWNDCILADLNDSTSINWTLRFVRDSGTASALDWQNRVLQSSGEQTTLDWDGRKLFDTDGNVNLTWGTPEIVSISGKMAATNGVASYAVAATNAIAATGITNTSTINRTALLTVTASAFAIKNNAGTVIYNSAAALTAVLPIPLQPGGAITGASGLSGTLMDW